MHVLPILTVLAGLVGVSPASAQSVPLSVTQTCRNEAMGLYRDIAKPDLRAKLRNEYVAECVRRPRRFGR